MKDGPANIASSPRGSRKERKSGTNSLAGSPASSPICRCPPIIVSSADDIPKPIPTPPLMPPTLTTVSSMPYSDRSSFRRSMSIVKPVARRVPVSRGPGVTSAPSLTTALRNKLSASRVLSRDVDNVSAPSEARSPPSAEGADPALAALVAVTSPEGKGPAPSPGPVDAVGTEPTATTGDGVSASSRGIRDDLIGIVRSLLDRLTFADQCVVIGIHPQKATRGVESRRCRRQNSRDRGSAQPSGRRQLRVAARDYIGGRAVRASPPGGGAGCGRPNSRNYRNG